MVSRVARLRSALLTGCETKIVSIFKSSHLFSELVDDKRAPTYGRRYVYAGLLVLCPSERVCVGAYARVQPSHVFEFLLQCLATLRCLKVRTPTA